jgi:hypothetical protein
MLRGSMSRHAGLMATVPRAAIPPTGNTVSESVQGCGTTRADRIRSWARQKLQCDPQSDLGQGGRPLRTPLPRNSVVRSVARRRVGRGDESIFGVREPGVKGDRNEHDRHGLPTCSSQRKRDGKRHQEIRHVQRVPREPVRSGDAALRTCQIPSATVRADVSARPKAQPDTCDQKREGPCAATGRPQVGRGQESPSGQEFTSVPEQKGRHASFANTIRGPPWPGAGPQTSATSSKPSGRTGSASSTIARSRDANRQVRI